MLAFNLQDFREMLNKWCWSVSKRNVTFFFITSLTRLKITFGDVAAWRTGMPTVAINLFKYSSTEMTTSLSSSSLMTSINLGTVASSIIVSPVITENIWLDRVMNSISLIILPLPFPNNSGLLFVSLNAEQQRSVAQEAADLMILESG